MTSDFQRLMSEATRLMRGGSLDAATAAIQQALGATTTTTAAPAPSPSGHDVIDVEARVVPEPGSPAAAPGVAPTSAESFTPGHFRNEAGARDYKLFVPAGAAAGRPLVVMLHGCTQDADDFARGTRMNALAREQGFVVLYPTQSRRANAQGCWNWFKHNHQARGKGEPAILAGMVREVVATHAIDPDRVYVAGLSAGGAMAAILGDAYPDLFAAVGVHSGLPTGSATDVQTAFAAMGGGAAPVRRGPRHGPTPPTIVFHGDADTTVNVVNGERVMHAAGVFAAPDVRRGSSDMGVAWSCRRYVDAHGADRAQEWIVHGAGHAWSGGDPAGSYTDPRGPDASAEMLRFFLRHPRR